MKTTIPEYMARLRFFFEPPVLRPLLLGLVFVAAFCFRLYGIGQPPMEFNTVRQYHGALLARGLYEWLLTGNMQTVPPDGILEPPILEFVASISYLVLGGVHLWIPRLLSALFWMIGGVFVYLIAKRLVSPNAAAFSVFFYLFDPATVTPSRAFLPDSLMVMLLVMSVFAILRYHEEPSTRRLMVATMGSSLAVFVKPGICLFQLLGAFVALAGYRRGIRKALVDLRFLVFAVLIVLPSALYYLYGTYLAGFLHEGQAGRLGPGEALGAYFWEGWLRNIEVMVGYIPFLGALLGVMLLRSGPARALLVGLWSGYLLFGFAFAHHIHTHNYYSLQLIPVVALSLGALWDSIANYLARVDSRRIRQASVLGLCLLAVVVGVFEHRQTIVGLARTENYPPGSLGEPRRNDYEGLVKDYREIGEVVHHSRHTVFFAPDFGYSLMYHARIDGEYWPPPGLDGKIPPGFLDILPMEYWPRNPEKGFDKKDYFDAVYSNASPKYFIVVRRFVDLGQKKNWRRDETLSEITENYRVAAKEDDYVVFDLTKKKRIM